MKATRILIALSVLVSGACNFDIADPNNPGPIGTDPSPSQVGAAVTGIIIASRAPVGFWNLISGILGREAYRFDGSEPRYISELLHGPLDPGDGFGGGQWAGEYTAIRSTYQLIDVIGTATAYSAADQDAVRGFAETMQAYEFLMVVMARSQDSIPVTVDQPLTASPAPFVSNDSAFGYVSGLLDAADGHLASGGTTFPAGVSLPSGFAGFDTPPTFRKFNRALNAAVQVYRGSLGCGAPCYTTAKTLLENGSTFVDTSASADLQAGVYFNFSTNPGDAANPLFQNPQTGENHVNPRVVDSADVNGATIDKRVTAKVVARPTQTTDSLTSAYGWIRYGNSNAPIPIIKNEELVLLRAEANNALGNAAAAAADVNYIRVTSGGVLPIAGLAAQTQGQILGAILHERWYSLLYEGHRWFDLRRTGRLGAFLLDRPDDQVFSTLPIPLGEVQARQP
jgi:starch-binding outer membrane protein, SusD/RagB family